MMAMLKLWRSQVLRDLGWKLLLQIHDEVILEGPKETVNEVRLPLSQSCTDMWCLASDYSSHTQAMKEVRACMENPFDDVLQKMRGKHCYCSSAQGIVHCSLTKIRSLLCHSAPGRGCKERRLLVQGQIDVVPK